MTRPARTISLLVVAALAMAGAASGGAQAQVPLHFGPAVEPEPPPVDSVLGGVTVSVPKVVERTRYGVVGLETTMSVRVPYGDLDMSTAEGVATLDARVAEGAAYVCDQLDRMFPEGTPEERACARNAVRDAGPQVRRAKGVR